MSLLAGALAPFLWILLSIQASAFLKKRPVASTPLLTPFAGRLDSFFDALGRGLRTFLDAVAHLAPHAFLFGMHSRNGQGSQQHKQSRYFLHDSLMSG